MEYRVWLGGLATAIAIVSYIPYFRDILLGKTKPHAFSWLVWSLLTGIGFVGQVVGGGGPGAWVTAFTALIAFLIFLFALRQGERTITRVDWLSLVAAGVALTFWFVTKGPLLSVILITVVDMLGFVPTFRKSWNKPEEETMLTYALSSLKFIIAIIALEKVTLVTALYPISLVLANAAFVALLLIRRSLMKINRPRLQPTQPY